MKYIAGTHWPETDFKYIACTLGRALHWNRAHTQMMEIYAVQQRQWPNHHRTLPMHTLDTV